MSSAPNAHKSDSSRSSPKDCAQHLSTRRRTLTELPKNDSPHPSLQTPRLPCSDQEWTETEWKRNQELAMNALLELQAQQAVKILPTPDIGPRVQIPCKEMKQTPSRGRTTAASRTPTKLSSVASNNTELKFLVVNEPCHRSVPTNKQDAPYCAPVQNIPTNKSQHDTAQNPDALRIILPSITFVPRAEDERLYSPIHFPSLTYIIHDTEDDSYNSASASSILPKQHFPQGQIDTEATFQPSPPPQSPPTPLIRKAKTGKEIKQPYIPYRRWSRTHLNRLTHQLAPRNLPEHLSFTDNVDLQNIPLQKLVPEFKWIETDNEGCSIVVMTGSRFEAFDEVANWGRDRYAVSGSLDIVDSVESGRIVRRTPFRLLIRDEAGQLVANLAWSVDVTDNDMLSDSCTEGRRVIGRTHR